MTYELEINFSKIEDAKDWVNYVTVYEHFCGEIHQDLEDVKMSFHHADDIKPFMNLALHWSTITTYKIFKY